MDERQKLFIAQDWVRKLANGINPLNGNAVKEDDIVNDVHVSRCLFYVADILGKCSERKTIAYILRNNAFDPAAVQRDRYHYVDAISIAPFAQEIEKLIPEDMEAISYKSIVQWLTQKGLLLESEPDRNGRTYKIPSEEGRKVGIYTEDRENNGGHYLITLYNREAQKYILEHLAEINDCQKKH